MDNLKIAKEIKQKLLQNFGDEINKVVLFGSQSRGTANGDSDYDILVVLEHDYDWRTRRRISHSCYDVDLEYDVFTDVKVISVNELHSAKGRQPFIVNALKEGIAL
ncbi:MAG: nucleotidyltransferase domain-containing protein [bacterium]|nr:nucleotidyltransferase domain-containing protein [bacterium]